MIFKTLKYIAENVNEYLISEPQPMNPENDNLCLVLENVSKVEDSNFTGNNKVILSLVNVEEESALKNQKAYQIINGTVEYQRAPVILNLYVLFSANLNEYEDGLKALSKVMAFFQAKNFFSYSEDPPGSDGMALGFTPEEIEIFDISLDLYTMTFEQLNHLWGSLGGKQVPSAMYKVRLVPVKRDLLLEEGGLIERIRRSGTVD